MFLGGSSKRQGRPGQLQLLLPARVSPTGQAERLHGWRDRAGMGQGRMASPRLVTLVGTRGVRADTSPSGQSENTPVITAEAQPQTSGLGQHPSKSGLRRTVRRGWDAPPC